LTKLRLGVIGAGSWATTSHLPVLARRDDVEFVAVCRHGSEALEQVRRQFGFQLASEDFHDVLAADVDLCVVSSPASYHYEHAKSALVTGAHVFVEKPFTLRPEEAHGLEELTQVTGRHLAIAFGWNYNPMVTEARRLIRELGVGAIEHVSLEMASATRELLSGVSLPDDAGAPDPGTWIDPSRSGGGYGQAQLSHALGVALWVTGLTPSSAFALTPQTSSADAVELHDALVVRFDGGAIASISGSSVPRGTNDNRHHFALRVTGDAGVLHLDLGRELVRLARDGGSTEIALPVTEGAGRYECESALDNFVDLASGREASNASPAELGVRTVQVLDAAYRSVDSGQMEPVIRFT
jgi:predicted dehydrogenase